MRGKLPLMLVTLGALALTGARPAVADQMNLWVSYQFTALDSYASGNYTDAAHLLAQAESEDATRFRKADTYDALGRVYTALGRFDDAETAFSEALRMKEGSLGRNHREVAAILNNLADLRHLRGQTESVEALYRRALEINHRDQLNVEVGRSLNGLALVHYAAGEIVEAEKLLQRAAALHDKAQRRDDPYLATVLTNLGILYNHQGRFDEAGVSLERARYIQGVSLRKDHPDVAVRLHATAVTLDSTGRRGEAVTLANEAEAIRSKQAAKGDLY
jgi:tetratricopeptide (TPR) repeat protein